MEPQAVRVLKAAKPKVIELISAPFRYALPMLSTPQTPVSEAVLMSNPVKSNL